MSKFNNSYKKYYLIIEEAKRKNRLKNNGVYYEKHHIIPKSMGGSNSPLNLVLLTPEEHYICHSLLPDFCDGLSYYKAVQGWNALNNMGGVKESLKIIGPKKYAELKKDYAASISGDNSPFARDIYQIDKGTGDVIEKWSCISEAARTLRIDSARLSHSARGKNRTCLNYVWVFPEDYNEEKKQEIINCSYTNSGKDSASSKAIYQVNKDTGKIIKEWDCLADASKTLKILNISQAVNGLLSTAGGYVWVFPKDYKEKKIELIIQKNYSRNGSNNPSASPVLQLDINNSVIKEWGFIKEAAESLKICSSCISDCCRGKQKTAKGFKWVYKNGDL